MTNTQKISGNIPDSQKISGEIKSSKTIYKDNYNDLKNKPCINGVVLKGDLSDSDLKITADSIANLHKVSLSGDYNDLENTPSFEEYVDSKLSEKLDVTTYENEKTQITQKIENAETRNNLDTSRLKSEIGTVKKNLITHGYTVVSDLNGITFTLDSEKKITCNGTATAWTSKVFSTYTKLLAGEKYIGSGSLDGSGESTYNL